MSNLLEVMTDLKCARENMDKLRGKKVISLLAWKMWNLEIMRNIDAIEKGEY